MEQYRRIKRIIDSAFEICDIGPPLMIPGVPRPIISMWFHSIKQLVIVFNGNQWSIDRVSLEILTPPYGRFTPKDIDELLDSTEIYLSACSKK